jgi:protein-disulfide isomerase
MSGTRRERRETELADRRERRQRQRQRGKQAAARRYPILPITLGVLALAVVGVLVYALFLAPPAGDPGADVRSPSQPAPYELADGNALGSAEAPLTIEIWSDYQCPACAQLARTYEPMIISEYVEDGRARLVMRDFAFLGPESVDAAIAARCAERQGRFWQMHDYLFANHDGEGGGAFSQVRLEAMAQSAGLDLEQYRACRAEPVVRSELAAEIERGRQLGVNSTPTLIVGDQMVAGVPRQWEQLAALIDQQLEAAGE